jgi:hypothetical protein
LTDLLLVALILVAIVALAGGYALAAALHGWQPWGRGRKSAGGGSADRSGPTDLDFLADRIGDVDQNVKDLHAAVRRVEQLLRQPAEDHFQSAPSLAASSPVRTRGVAVIDSLAAVSDVAVVESHDERSTSAGKFIREFLRRVDEGPMTSEQAQALAATNGCRFEVVRWAGDEWRIVAAGPRSRKGEWLAVPVPRVPMGNAELEDWFHLSRYSGIDPLKPHQITRPAVLSRQQNAWSLVDKGQIDGGQ